MFKGEKVEMQAQCPYCNEKIFKEVVIYAI